MPITQKDTIPIEEIARRLFDGIEAGDTDTLLGLYADNAILWTNVSQRTVDARQLAKMLPVIIRKIPERRYVNRRITLMEEGFIHRHTIRATHPGGGTASVECCAIVKLSEGKVTRIDEYFDSHQIRSVMGQ